MLNTSCSQILEYFHLDIEFDNTIERKAILNVERQYLSINLISRPTQSFYVLFLIPIFSKKRWFLEIVWYALPQYTSNNLFFLVNNRFISIKIKSFILNYLTLVTFEILPMIKFSLSFTNNQVLKPKYRMIF